jgi:hypothetical protein
MSGHTGSVSAEVSSDVTHKLQIFPPPVGLAS